MEFCVTNQLNIRSTKAKETKNMVKDMVLFMKEIHRKKWTLEQYKDLLAKRKRLMLTKKEEACLLAQLTRSSLITVTYRKESCETKAIIERKI